jgi:predicted DNA-binding transcriptional regulator AlpA
MQTVRGEVTGSKPGATPDNSISGFAFTITEFCKAHKISRAFFYDLQRDGFAPRVMRLGTRRLISVEEAKRWREAHTERQVA